MAPVAACEEQQFRCSTSKVPNQSIQDETGMTGDAQAQDGESRAGQNSEDGAAFAHE